MAFVLVQHLDPGHTSILSAALGRATTMPVEEILDGVRPRPDHVYVIPPAFDVSLHQGALSLVPRQQDERKPHLSIDIFFRSLAADRGAKALGVVLSGTGSDGTLGLKAIKAAEGLAFAQQPESAKFPGMPASAIAAGVVDVVKPPRELAAEVARLGGQPHVRAKRSAHAPADDARDLDVVQKVLAVIRDRTGVDFSEYKKATVQRRLARRMALHRIDGLQEYLDLLQTDDREANAVFADILIHVTSFFRDPDAFEALKRKVFPVLMAERKAGRPVRMWVTGCSTGEEAYSLAICFIEFLGNDRDRQPIQIFGTDVSAKAIETARHGFYPTGSLAEVSEERLRRFFTKIDGGYRLTKSVRDLCVFSQHDLTSDPPFSRLDLVACRNVLIYFDQALQRRVLSSFHYCLNHPGFLMLGRSESVLAGPQFSPISKDMRIYARSSSGLARHTAPPRTPSVLAREAFPVRPFPTDDHLTVAGEVDALLLSRYSPPGVVVDERLDVLQFRGRTGPWLEAAPGEPQNNLLKMARDGLLADLRLAISQAKKSSKTVRREGVAVRTENGAALRTCTIVVHPLPRSANEKTSARLFLILFEEARPSPPLSKRPLKGRRSVLERELRELKSFQQSLILEHQQTNDILAASNEELLSGNEELQSLNEELETAKEELQSTNEELNTVNDELQSRNAELGTLNNDLVNVLDSVDIPVLILDAERRIRRFTPKARGILSLLPSDIGRPIRDIRFKLDSADLDQEIAEAISTNVEREREVQDGSGRWHRMRIRPYRTVDEEVEGAVITLVDIDALKKFVGEAEAARAEADAANRAKDLFLAVLSHELRTPLNTLLLQTQILRRGPLDDEKVQRSLDVIERASRTQAQLVEDLLDISRIIAGKLKINAETIDLVAVVRASIEQVTALAQAKSIAIDADLSDSVGRVSGDSVRLQQVVLNLLTNAIKFTPDHGHVTLELVREDGFARLRVRDTGVGIDPELLPRVFDRFTQGETSSTTRSSGGLGLGLAIVRHIVDLHGGTIRVESEGKMRGTTFTLDLPLLSGALPDTRDSGSRSIGSDAKRRTGRRGVPPLAGRRVLFVEDDTDSRKAVSEVLTVAGAEVHAVGSSGEALAILAGWRPDVFLFDIGLPVEDGCTLLERIRARAPAGEPVIPAIALTAFAGAAERERAAAVGFRRYLTKPIDVDDLLGAIDEVLIDAKPSGPNPTPPS